MVPYMPDRVMRQFGNVQGIPEDPKPKTRAVVTREVADERWANFDQWLVERGAYITQGEPDTIPGYAYWFGRVSHPFIDKANYVQLEDEPDCRQVRVFSF